MLTSPQSIINCSFQMCQRGKGLSGRLEREKEEVGRRGEREDTRQGAVPAGPPLSSAAETRPQSQGAWEAWLSMDAPWQPRPGNDGHGRASRFQMADQGSESGVQEHR